MTSLINVESLLVSEKLFVKGILKGVEKERRKRLLET
jgi:hypothetical protein